MKKRAVALALALASVALADDRAPAGAPSLPPEDTSIARASTDAAMAAHAERVVDYTLRATLDPVAHTVHGEGTIRWTNASAAPVSELWLHLYMNAFKNESSVWQRQPIGRFRGGAAVRDWGAIDLRRLVWKREADADLLPRLERSRPGDPDETDARAPLPSPVAPGQTITLELAWDVKLPSVVERTGYDRSFHMVGQWFPKVAKLEPDGQLAHFPFHHLSEFYSDFGTYDVTLDVPAGFLVAATGPVVERRAEGGRAIQRHVQSDVHDFAWMAWDEAVERTERIDGVDVRILHHPAYAAVAERELAAMRFALPHFRERYGRYPYSVLTLVHPPDTAREAGGMEYPTLITTGGPWWMPEGFRQPELVTIHEFGHQYFYGLVATNEERWPFLDEGLNSYAEAECLRAWLGPGSASSLLSLGVGDHVAQAVSSRRFVHDEPVARRAGDFVLGQDYGGLVYGRTATVLETTARVWGKPAMDRAMGTYARTFRYRHPGPADLLAILRDVVDPRAATAAKVALFDKGWVDYVAVEAVSRKPREPAGLFDRGGKRETVAATSGAEGRYTGYAVVSRRGTLSYPVDVLFVAEDGTRTTRSWDGVGDTTRLPYEGTSPLAFVVVDPEHKVLVDQDSTNNMFATGARAGAPRIMERAVYFGQLALEVALP
ncbi:MAG: M1 family metallopeptidase [Myxococcales bacterium]|jgi:hypothetical protein|nr:M1 family metallopeptidase [Myxococcales bacterium]